MFKLLLKWAGYLLLAPFVLVLILLVCVIAFIAAFCEEVELERRRERRDAELRQRLEELRRGLQP